MADLIRFFPHSYEPHDLEKYSADGGRCVPGSNIINSPQQRVQKRRNRVECPQRRQPPEQDEYGSGKDSERPSC